MMTLVPGVTDSLDVRWRLLLSALRAICIVVGGTFAADLLVSGLPSITPAPGYPGWVADGLSPGSLVLEALGNTLLLAAAGALTGLLLGMAFGAVLRSPTTDAVFGPGIAPALATAGPAMALVALYVMAVRLRIAPTFAVPFDESFVDGVRWLAVAALVVGLPVAPAIAVAVAGDAGDRRFGRNVGLGSIAPRPEMIVRWRFGFPTTAFLVALASVELVFGSRGLFALFISAAIRQDISVTLEIVVVVVVGGALLSLAADVVGLRTERRSPVDPPAAATTRISRLVAPVLAAVGVLVVMAIIGGLLDADAIDPTAIRQQPTFGGPWLGTDELGRSVAARTAAAVGPTLLSGVGPSVVALIGGSVIALIRANVTAGAGWLIDALVDVFWWPMVLLLPLTYLFFDLPERPDLHLGIAVFTGLMLMPAASRMLTRTVFPRSAGWPGRAVAAWLAVYATAITLAVFVGFVGFAGRPGRDLGGLLGGSRGSLAIQPWATLGPAIATVGVLTLIHWLGSCLAVPTRPARTVPEPPGSFAPPDAGPGKVEAAPTAPTRPSERPTPPSMPTRPPREKPVLAQRRGPRTGDKPTL